MLLVIIMSMNQDRDVKSQIVYESSLKPCAMERPNWAVRTQNVEVWTSSQILSQVIS